MTIPLLLLAAAFLLILANGFFVAAEFGLVTVERPDAERAAAEGDRRARTRRRARCGSCPSSSPAPSSASPSPPSSSACSPNRRSPSCSTGPLTATGLPEGAVSGVAVVDRHAARLRRPDGDRRARPQELGGLPAAAGRPLRRRPAARLLPRSSGPVIALLNTVANRLVRLLGVEPAEELASARTPGELVSLARHSAQAGALEQDTADLFVRTLSLGELTAQHVMTPRVKVSALQCDGHRGGRPQPHPRHRPVPLPRLPGAHRRDRRHGPPQGRPRRARRTTRLRTPRRPDRRRRRCWCPRRCPCSRCWSGCAASSPSPSSSTSTAAPPVSSPWRTSSRSSSARSATSTTPRPTTGPNWPPSPPRTAAPPGTPTAAAGSTPCAG